MTEKQNFNNWMIKIKNIYYPNNDLMVKAYEKIIEPKKIKKNCNK